MKYNRYIVYICLAFSAFVSCGGTKGETLIFEENFNGNTLNASHWNYELGDGCPNLCGWGNNERQQYTKKNVEVANGNLTITATKQGGVYQSGRITTKNKVEFTYGTIEIRAKLPKGNGLWPALWMLGSNIGTLGWPACGEIDIMEYVGKQPGVVHTSLHTPSSFGKTINTKKNQRPDIEEGFHVYKTVWTAGSIRFSIDGEQVYTYAPSQKNNKNWPYDKPFYVLINMAIGGDFGGPVVDDSIFPQVFTVDYIKIYRS